jgi:hypothetical protein
VVLSNRERPRGGREYITKRKVLGTRRTEKYAPCREDVWGSGDIAPQYLISAVDKAEWSASRPGRFTPGERAAGTHLKESWMGTGAGLDSVKKRKTPASAGNRTLAVQPVALQIELSLEEGR